MLIAHKIALNPNNKQRTYFAKACGVARFAYNWALANWQQQYVEHKKNNDLPKPNEQSLRKQLNAIKREQFPFMLEVTKCAPQQAIKDLGKAFKNFWDGRAKYPQFRKKKTHNSFYLSNDVFHVAGKKIKIPHVGWVRMTENLRFSGKIMSATISRTADTWFVSICVEIEKDKYLSSESDNFDNLSVEKQNVKEAGADVAVGVDLGVKSLATLSNGEVIEGAKPLKKLLKRLKRLSRNLSKKKLGSKNSEKARRKIAKLHAKIGNIRQDCLHKLTTKLAHNYDIIAIEDLNVQGMMKNRKLSRAIADMGFFEFKRQLQYKMQNKNGQLVIVDRWFPSSKLCSHCGYKMDTDKMTLDVRNWQCPNCNTQHDRDVNAAINLRKFALLQLANNNKIT